MGEEDYLMIISNALNEKLFNHPKFLEADRYFAGQIQSKFGDAPGYIDEEYTIGMVSYILGIETDELLKILEVEDEDL